MTSGWLQNVFRMTSGWLPDVFWSISDWSQVSLSSPSQLSLTVGAQNTSSCFISKVSSLADLIICCGLYLKPAGMRVVFKCLNQSLLYLRSQSQPKYISYSGFRGLGWGYSDMETSLIPFISSFSLNHKCRKNMKFVVRQLCNNITHPTDPTRWAVCDNESRLGG